MRKDGVSGYVERLFGMLLGGLIASFVAAVVLTLFAGDVAGFDPAENSLPAIVGVACVTVFMVLGLMLDRVTWAAYALLFASGFTGLWTAGVSFIVQSRLLVLAAWLIAIFVGAAVAWFRFERAPQHARSAHRDVSSDSATTSAA